nr:hypothetical protein [Gammaproteobacteria bacterium]
MPALMPAPTLTQRVSSISIVPAPYAEMAQRAPIDPTRGAALVRDDAIRFSFFVHVLPPVSLVLLREANLSSHCAS